MSNFDILAVLCSYLQQETGLPVMTEVPETRPKAFINVFRDGGARFDIRFDNPTISIWIWGASEAEAYTKANVVRSALQALPGTCYEVSSARELSTRVNNHESGHHRYESVWSLTTII